MLLAICDVLHVSQLAEHKEYWYQRNYWVLLHETVSCTVHSHRLMVM